MHEIGREHLILRWIAIVVWQRAETREKFGRACLLKFI